MVPETKICVNSVLSLKRLITPSPPYYGEKSKVSDSKVVFLLKRKTTLVLDKCDSFVINKSLSPICEYY